MMAQLRMIPIVALGIITGCTSVATHREPDDWRARLMMEARKPGIVAQFCTFKTNSPNFLIIHDIRRKDGVPKSIGSAVTAFVGKSTSGQSVFLSYLGTLDEFAGATVLPPAAPLQVFVPMSPLSEWSDWQFPSFLSNDRDVELRIMNGRKVSGDSHVSPVVMARFRVNSYVEYSRETDAIRKAGHNNNLLDCPLQPND